jgi:ABC-type multidrug transport system fused ATPase/permease subunit
MVERGHESRKGLTMRELYAYVWRSSASQQIVLIILAIIAAVLATAPLEFQRHIINTLAGHEKVENLVWLCGGYLIAALSIGGLKYIVNIRSAGLGEYMIRSLREAVLRSVSPSINLDATPDETRKAKSGALVTTISSQAEAVGKFVGDCISTPIVQAGTLLSVLSYMLYTESRLGVVVLFIAVPQLFLVPMIQRRLNVYVRERTHTLVRAGDLIVDPALQRGTSAGSLSSEISKAFETIYFARLRTFKLKFGLKFLISALQSMAVFILLFAGGIMVLNGKTEIGIVVAFISGLDRVLEPWREMIAFVRSTSSAKVQFDLIESTLDTKL